MLATTELTEHLLDTYGHCDRDIGKINNCYWGKDEFGNWNGCLRVGWLGRKCQHWRPLGATNYDDLMERMRSTSLTTRDRTGGET